MTESEIYKELGVLTKSKDRWEENIPYVTSLLASDSVKVKAKALWMLGEMGLAFIWASENIGTNTPDPYGDYMPVYAELLHDSDDHVRMEAPEMFRVLGKRCPKFVEPFLNILQWTAENDAHPVVRIHCAGAVRIIEKREFNY